MTERCGICGKFISSAIWNDTMLCPEHKEYLKKFDELNSAIFGLEQTLRKLEKTDICRPLYRMRCNLGEMKDAFRKGRKVCEFIPTLELMYLVK